LDAHIFININERNPESISKSQQLQNSIFIESEAKAGGL
jgi:hypothetical protein